MVLETCEFHWMDGMIGKMHGMDGMDWIDSCGILSCFSFSCFVFLRNLTKKRGDVIRKCGFERVRSWWFDFFEYSKLHLKSV